MDIHQADALRRIAEIQTQNAQKYADARREAGEAEASLKIILTSHLKELRGNKKNLGVEMAILMLCEDNDEARKLLKEWTQKEAIYKGLEKLLEATAAKLIFEQSLMKFQSQGEKWG